MKKSILKEMHEEAWTTRTLKLTSSEVNRARWALTWGKSFRTRLMLGVVRPYLTTYHYKKKHKPQVRCKITVFKITQLARLQATSESAKNEKITNLKELPRPYKLSQGASAERIKSGVEIGKTYLPPVGPLCLSKVLKEGQPPQRHRLPTIGK